MKRFLNPQNPCRTNVFGGGANLKGFTLAEVLITLTILGVIAAITVPSILHNNQTRINKTRLKKAMATYDNAISQMSIFSRIKTKNEFKDWAEGSACENALTFFKYVPNTQDGCKFKTSDGVWWDISNIDRTIVSFKEANLDEAKAKDFDDKEAFILVTSFDKSNGTLRVDDLGYETSNHIDFSDVYVAKLYEFINGQELNITFDICKAKQADICTVNGTQYTKVHMGAATVSEYNGGSISVPGDNNYVSRAEEGDYYVADLGFPTDYEQQARDCTGSTSYLCSTKGDYFNAAKRYCENSGARLANLAEISALSSTNTSTFGYWAYEGSLRGDSHQTFQYVNNSRIRRGVSIGNKHSAARVLCVNK